MRRFLFGATSGATFLIQPWPKNFEFSMNDSGSATEETGAVPIEHAGTASKHHRARISTRPGVT